MRQLWRWSGLAALGAGIAVLAVTAAGAPANMSTVALWLYSDVLSPERLLAFAGLGLAMASVPVRAAVAAALAAVAGFGSGLAGAEAVWSLFVRIPSVDPPLLLLGPLSCVVVGASLVAPDALRGWILPVAAAAVALALALLIDQTNPYLGASGPDIWAATIAVWVVASVWATASGRRRPWFRIAGAILGSWLVAIGILSGGASFVPKPSVLAPGTGEFGWSPPTNGSDPPFPEDRPWWRPGPPAPEPAGDPWERERPIVP